MGGYRLMILLVGESFLLWRWWMNEVINVIDGG